MLERLTPAWRNVILALLGVLVLWFSWTVRSVLNPLIFGYLLAFVVHPMVLRLERRGWSRARAVNLIFFLAGLAGLAITLTLFVQARMLVTDMAREDGLFQRLEVRLDETWRRHQGDVQWLVDLVAGEDEGAPGEGAEGGEEPAGTESLAQVLRELWVALATEERVAQASEAGLRAAGRGFGLLRRSFGSILGFLAFVLLLPVYTYFLLFEMERIHGFVRRYLPQRDRERLAHIGGQIGEVLASFFRGRLLVCLLKGLVLAAGLFIVGVDYAFLIGLTSGFLGLIPFVGAFLGAVAAVLFALLEHSLVGGLVRVVIVFGLTEVIEGYVLIPKVLGDSLGLHPVVVLVSIFVGGAALGMFGFLIALPLTATLVILARELVLPALADFADEGESEDAGAAAATGPTPPRGSP